MLCILTDKTCKGWSRVSSARVSCFQADGAGPLNIILDKQVAQQSSRISGVESSNNNG